MPDNYVTPYVPTEWHDLPNKSSPIKSTSLNNIEMGIKNLNDFVNVDLATLINALLEALGNIDVSDLNDVILSNLQNGDGLKYRAQDGKWINGPVSSSMSSLTDVLLTNIQNGDGLRYDSTVNKWKNGPSADVLDWFDTMLALQPGTIPYKKTSNFYYHDTGEILEGKMNKTNEGDCYGGFYIIRSNECKAILVSANLNYAICTYGGQTFSPGQNDYITYKKDPMGQPLKWWYTTTNSSHSASGYPTSEFINYAGDYITSPAVAAEAMIKKVYES